jgi:hypothetical protein
MQNYSKIEELLHDLVFSTRLINKSLFEIEKFFYKNDQDIKNQPHIFISGMPRSGTTSLLNFIFSSQDFASLTYKSMPFILSPNLSKFLNKKNLPTKERLHSDNIDFDINSPEALDEVFFDNKEVFIRKELTNYIKLVLLSKNKSKYLSKNNLNYKRIDLIHSILPDSIFLIPVREPLQHSYSLLNQHIKFTKLQKEENFIRRYMKYLGHFEFGLDHKPWNDPEYFYNFNNINYWLEQWILFYKYIFEKFENYKNCHFIIYEKLFDIAYIERILEKVKVDKKKFLKIDYFRNYNKNEIAINYDKKNYNEANLIYKKFLNGV